MPERSAELAEAMRHHDAIAPTVTDPMGRERSSCSRRAGKLIANFGIGVNHIDIAAAHENGMQVGNTPGVLTDATADIALTLMLMTMRRAGEGERDPRRWLDRLAADASARPADDRQDAGDHRYGADRQGHAARAHWVSA